MDGPVEAIEHNSDKDSDVLRRLPDPPREWGRPDPLLTALGHRPFYPKFPTPPLIRGDGALSFRNGQSVDLTTHLTSLRPKRVFESEADEVVLLLRSHAVDAITGWWRATAKGHHTVFEGTLSVDVAELRDWTEPMREILMSPPAGADP